MDRAVVSSPARAQRAGRGSRSAGVRGSGSPPLRRPQALFRPGVLGSRSARPRMTPVEYMPHRSRGPCGPSYGWERVTRDAAEPLCFRKPAPRRPAAPGPCGPRADFASRFLGAPRETPLIRLDHALRRSLETALAPARRAQVVVPGGQALGTAPAQKREPGEARVEAAARAMQHRLRGAGPPPLRQPDPVITAAPSVERSAGL